MEITYNITIADLVQAIGVGIGFPAALWGLVKLFKKDREREKEIKALIQIAKSQGEQIEELKKQTAESKLQTLALVDSNQILADQLKLQTEAFLNDKDYKNRLLKIEDQKKKNLIKPLFDPSGGSSTGGEFKIIFKNIGKRAVFKGVELVENENVSIRPVSSIDRGIDTNGTIEIDGLFTGQGNYGNAASYKLNILFTDIEGTLYYQTYMKDKSRKWNLTQPAER